MLCEGAMKKLAALAVVLGLGTLLASTEACSSSVTAGPVGDAGSATCQTDVEKDDYCASCTAPSNASPSTCKTPRTVSACCTYTTPPTQELERGTGLNRYSSADPTLNLGCLDAPGELGTPKNVKLKGFVWLFSSGNDSSGVKVEIFKEGPNGAVGEPVGTPTETKTTDEFLMPRPVWLKKCPDGGCAFRAYTYEGVPTETPLIVRTSDVNPNGSQWKPLYDYNVMFRNSEVTPEGTVSYNPNAVAATDVNTVAAAAGGFVPKSDRGVLAGEVHDCGDVRVAGAMVDTDVAHEADLFYFGSNEADPLPDQPQARSGTSKLGLFGALNFQTGVPIRVTAVGQSGGKKILLGTHVVQAFPGAVTALSLRGRRPYQK